MEEVPKRKLAKQRFVTEHLKSAFPNIRWRIDRKIQGGSSSRRPDLIWDFGTFVLIIEIDEDQHKNYDKPDLRLREKELLSDLKGKKLIIIYFNPDEYIDEKRITHPSIFHVENGEAYPLTGWRERFNVLVKTINEQEEPEKRFSRVKLFFDFGSDFTQDISDDEMSETNSDIENNSDSEESDIEEDLDLNTFSKKLRVELIIDATKLHHIKIL